MLGEGIGHLPARRLGGTVRPEDGHHPSFEFADSGHTARTGIDAHGSQVHIGLSQVVVFGIGFLGFLLYGSRYPCNPPGSVRPSIGAG